MFTRQSSISIGKDFQFYAVRVFEEIQRILYERPEGRVLVQLVLPFQKDLQLYSALSALLKTAHLENPQFVGQVIEVASGESQQEIEARLAENSHHPDDHWVRYHDGRRYVARWNEVKPSSLSENRLIPWKERGIYLITGGMGGLGLIFAREIAHHIRSGTMILTGRLPLDAEKETRCKELAGPERRVIYRQLDVTALSSVTEIIQHIREEFGTLNGIIHSAGIIHDTFILKKSREQFLEVLAPKVMGVVNLDQASQHLNLDIFLIFSSIAGSFGNPGQADYATANAFMDAYARYRNLLVAQQLRSGRTLSMSWPLWHEGGMHVDQQTEELIERSTGQIPMQTSTGMKALYQALASDQDQVIVMEGDVQRLRSTFLGKRNERTEVASLLSTEGISTGPTMTDERLQERTAEYLKIQLSPIIKLPAVHIEANAALEVYGIDSLMAAQLTSRLENIFGPLPKTLFFEYRTIYDVATYFLETHREQVLHTLQLTGQPVVSLNGMKPQNTVSSLLIEAPNQEMTPHYHHPVVHQSWQPHEEKRPWGLDIAIIGLAGRYPGAQNMQEFWQNLRDGKDCIREIPPDRWDHHQYASSKWGGFLADIDRFDPLFFAISPRDAEKMDPQERLFLECVYETMEDAGYTRERPGSYRKPDSDGNVGVFVGVMYEEYQLYGAEEQLKGHPLTLSGSASSIANRVSYFYNFHGPSIALDTMCSSSLTAIHLACQSIQQGECDLALAGGVNVSVHPNKYLALRQGNFTSSKGRCESFGVGGDGYVPGEGVGAVLLKPLSRAVADGDHIYGVIKGSAINHGGKTNGYTVPNPTAQAQVISAALKQAGIDPRTISYLEAHGTGTALGDPIEIASLTRAYRHYTRDNSYCAIGSVKSNIGHGESSAGIAGLTKILLQMKYRQLVPSLHSSSLNPNISFESTPFAVQQDLSPWQHPIIDADGTISTYSRRAGLSSFGAGGSNAHIIIEEYIPECLETSHVTPDHPAIIVMSTKSQPQLRELVERLIQALKIWSFTDADLPSLAYTLQVGREAMEERLAFTATSLQDLARKLQGFLEDQGMAEGLYIGQSRQYKDILDVFSADEDMTSAIDAWSHKGEYQKLLKLWVKGMNFDWEKLYSGQRPRRISLPTYPFAREYCWLPINNRQPITSVAPALPSVDLHPLVQRNISDFSAQRFQSTFTGQEHFFTDHVIQGQRILPGVAHLEMAWTAATYALRAALKGHNGWLRLSDIAWARPLVAGEQPLSVQIELQLQEHETVAFTISDQPSETGKKALLYSRGRAHLYHEANVIPPLNLAALQNQCRTSLPVQSCYDAYQSLGITYGTGMQSLEQIFVGEEQVLARLSLPASVAWTASSYVLHPSLLDGALHASIGLMPEGLAGASLQLPFALDELELLRPLPTTAWAWVRRRQESPSLSQLDVDISDDQGQICVRICGLSARARPQQTHNSQVNKTTPQNPQDIHKTHTLLLTPVWEMAMGTESGRIPAPTGQVLIIGGTSQQQQEMARLYPRAAQLPQLPTLTTRHLSAHLQSYGAIEQLIWIAPAPIIPCSIDEHIISAQQQGVVFCFKLIKALLQQGYGKQQLTCTFVLFQSQQVAPGDPLDPTSASIHGLIGSLAKEYPSWHIRLLDLPINEPWPLNQLLTLPADPTGRAWVYRRQQWYQQQMVPRLSSPSSLREQSTIRQSGYRTGGVYVVIGGAGGIGQAWSEYMLKHYQAHIVWLGRRPLDAHIQSQQQQLAKYGPMPDYISADASDRGALAHAYTQIKQRYQRINGVIHAALVLHDQSLAHMSIEGFEAAITAKIHVSVYLAQVFAPEQLDFVLFFSSLNAFATMAGQSNYAAGCTFEDAFAQHLRQLWSCQVKVINWGYWGNVGVVATPHYREQMARMGLGSIEPDEAMQALETLLAEPIDQLGLLKTMPQSDSTQAMIPPSSGHVPSFLAQLSESKLLSNELQSCEQAIREQEMTEMDDLLCRLLLAQLHMLTVSPQQTTGGLSQSSDRLSISTNKIPPGISKIGRKWLEASITILTRKHYLRHDQEHSYVVRNANQIDGQAAWKALEHLKSHPHLTAQARLAETMLHALPDILLHGKRATEVMFPHSSLELVKDIYQQNPVVDSFNDLLAAIVIIALQERRKQGNEQPVRILEIGAGTGATSIRVLQKLRSYHTSVKEYCYTDISEAFLQHAQQTYGPEYPFLSYRLLTIELPLAEQGIQTGAYDLVIAANVLHATRNIRHVVRNAKAALKAGGLLLLNEISSLNIFTHLTFGLLDGWWAYEDPEMRIPGSPALTSEVWETVLTTEGFRAVYIPTSGLPHATQQVIAAESDGKMQQFQALPPNTLGLHISPQAQSESSRQTHAISPQNDTLLREKSREYFKSLIGDALKIAPARIDATERFQEYGMDSILMLQITEKLQSVMGNVSGSLFFEYPTIDELVSYFIRTQREALTQLVGPEHRPWEEELSPPPFPTVSVLSPSSEQADLLSRQFFARSDAIPPEDRHPQHDEVAIIGLAGYYPGAKTIQAFWQNLQAGKDCIIEIPADRRGWQHYLDEERRKNGSSAPKWGGFLDGIETFDPLFFNISPREAKQMDPQERLFLETTYASIEDAGYTPTTLCANRRVGVFVGVMNGNYASGVRYWSIANRISYLFGLHGPSLAVDSACSSSLTAIHLAVESLHSGTCACAIAGGVNLVVDPAHYMRLSEATMLSKGNQCRAFGEQADGLVSGEGVGAIVLKPLSRAIRDGDQIYGVIKGSMLNAGGKTGGYTVPNPVAQAELITEALQRAGVSARTISYIEAHGTGTILGDPIEIAGLTRAFAQETSDTQFCAIGSVKSNIGHGESAAGIAGLTKVLMQLKHGLLVPSLHAQVLNPHIDFSTTPFIVQQELAPWQRPRLLIDSTYKEYPRRAGISSFGAGGANAHLIIEEYRAQEHIPTRPINISVKPVLIPLSAKNADQLNKRVQQLLQYIEANHFSNQSLEDIAYTLQVGREAMQERLAVQVSTIDALCEKLRLVSESMAQGISHAIWNRAGIFYRKGKEPSDTQHQITIDATMNSEQQLHLLDLWVQGFSVDWQKLYRDGHPHRISLPTYPFAETSYWSSEPIARNEQEVVTTLSREASETSLLSTNLYDLDESSRHDYCLWLSEKISAGDITEKQLMEILLR